MQIEDARRLTSELMREHGLLELGWHYRIGKGTRTLGTCSHSKKRITIMGPYISHADEASVRETILHEIAHALVKPVRDPWTGRWDQHGAAWKAKCIEIGGSGERCGHNPYADKIRREKKEAALAAGAQRRAKLAVGARAVVRLPNSALHGTEGLVVAMEAKVSLELEDGKLVNVPKMFVEPVDGRH